jgi:hypothetical protein
MKSDAYFVEQADAGCERCCAGRTYAIVGPDGVGLGRTWDDADEAAVLAASLTEAFNLGKDSIRSETPASSNPEPSYSGNAGLGPQLPAPSPQSRNCEDIDAGALLKRASALAARAWLREWNAHPENAMKWNMTVHAAWVAPIFEALLHEPLSETPTITQKELEQAVNRLGYDSRLNRADFEVAEIIFDSALRWRDK